MELSTRRSRRALVDGDTCRLQGLSGQLLIFVADQVRRRREPRRSSGTSRGVDTPMFLKMVPFFFGGEAAYVTMGNGDNLYLIWKNRSQNGNIISQNLWNKYRGL